VPVLVQGDEVARWVAEKTSADLTAKAQAIGLLKDGKLIAGVAYDCYSGTNVFAHQRIEGRVTREFWWAVFSYPFEDLGCNRITGFVQATNDKAIKLNEHLGFVEECRLKGAAHDGSDMLLMVMWKKDCRMLNWRRT
jgi:RimJ/RimL family protein N-acetyltransferase